MTIEEIFDYVDEVKPNNYSKEIKTHWLNELEGKIQNEIMLLAQPEYISYVYRSSTELSGLSFPNDHTLFVPRRIKAHVGGELELNGLTLYAANNLKGLEILSISSDGKHLSFAEGSFTATGSAGDSGTLMFDGSATTPLIKFPFDRIYSSWLIMKVSEHLEESSQFANSAAQFRDDWNGFAAWYADTYRPADGVPTFKGYYLVGKQGDPGLPGKDGSDGITPMIGENGNWYFGEADTGKPSRGVPGKDGADGHTPVKGTDYWTASDKAEVVAEAAAAVDLTPYAKKTEVPTKTSQLTNDSGFLTSHQDISGKQDKSTLEADVAAKGFTKNADVFEYTNNPTFTNVFDTVGIEYGKLINITDKTVESTDANLATTDYIPVAVGSIVRVNEDFPIKNTGTPAFILYDSNKTATQALRTSSIVDGAYYVELVASDANGYITAFKINKPSSTAYIRITNDSRLIGKNPVLTVDEEINYEMGYGEKLNSKVKVDFSQVTNAPQKNCWSILPYERLNIAYSSIGRKPINTVEHFTDAATNFGYNALKCDVRPTSDGKLVCCHDAGFTFDGDGYITAYDSSNQTVIHDVTAATVLGYQFRTGEHPCLVGDYLDVCRKYGKVAFITIRNEYMDVVIPKLLEELKSHNMTYATIINCMTYNSLVTWRTYDQSVMINYTLNAGVAIDQSEIDRAIGLGYCSLCGFGLTSSATTPNHDCDFEYARVNGIRLLQAIAYKEGSPEACYAMGYDGCQIGIPWGTPTIPTVPTNVSSFTNDAGYLTLATLPKYEGVVE